MTYVRKERIIFLLMVSPALLLLAIFFIWPLFSSFWISFHTWPMFGKPKWVGLDNYIYTLNDSRFWDTLKFTTIYTFTATPMLFIVALITALLCNVRAWGTTFFRAIYFLPVVLSFATASYIWLWLYSEMYGIIIYFLELFGFGGPNKNLNVWTTPTSGLWAVNTMVTWKFSGIQMIILIAGLQAIRDDYNEASTLMGASRWQTIWHVTLPLLRPSIALCLILCIAGGYQAYEQFLIMTQGGPQGATRTLLMHTTDMGFTWFKLGPAASVGIFVMIIIFVITAIQLRLFKPH